ncbi:transposase InsO family protein [Nocardia transvalensis]|uniref:Transposase InsO family protein n=1 Tax=Nocardia transvalensis TaxID=37333 RepID=A0A7W9PDZ5_9NOCA|nr:Mu transposase C-terminal domain-containing protein [Nocardia transvalensis]MBB5913933.1 transposase InsO family protein [Nocardia transvalensis]
MTEVGVRVGIGTRVLVDGDLAEVMDLTVGQWGIAVTLHVLRTGAVVLIALSELMKEGGRARVVAEVAGSATNDSDDDAAAILSMLDKAQRESVRERAAHVREVLTGYRSGNPDLAQAGEPRADYDPHVPLTRRYAAKAKELSVGLRTLQGWVAAYKAQGEAGLAQKPKSWSSNPYGRVDARWVEAALEVMVEHTTASRPSQLMVIRRTNARVELRFGAGAVPLPSQPSAYRVLAALERQHPLFRLSTKRNRDISERPKSVYGSLRPTRPGEYLLMDTTRLDVFALDPVTVKWVQLDLTVAMDWYSRCIVGIRLTPVSPKSIDAAATMYQVFRPPAAGNEWPAQAIWPGHGVPRTILIDSEAIKGPITDGVTHPPLVPETLVIDHGKIYVSEHMTSVCARMGISIQPARLRTGRDKGPVERFFRTLREDLLQALPGYKGPDLHSRGERPEDEAIFYLDELDTIVREWVGQVYHLRPHAGLVDPHQPGQQLSPALMFQHGVARAGYVEVPSDPHLAYEFLPVAHRTVQHYGIDFGGRVYKGVLGGCSERLVLVRGKMKRRIIIRHNPDDITHIYVRSDSGDWRTLTWEHASSLDMPLSEDALRFARKLAETEYAFPSDKLAVTKLLERWNLGLGRTLAERRMALRQARSQQWLLDEQPAHKAEDQLEQLPSVARVLATSSEQSTVQWDNDSGDDDSDEELDPMLGGDGGDDFYADALENL